MSEWLLIVAFTYSGTVLIPGYTSQQECLDAGRNVVKVNGADGGANLHWQIACVPRQWQAQRVQK